MIVLHCIFWSKIVVYPEILKHSDVYSLQYQVNGKFIVAYIVFRIIFQSRAYLFHMGLIYLDDSGLNIAVLHNN